jgi:hypothetical protein
VQGILETFWQIIIALFAALAIGGLVVGAVILGVGCALFGCGWLYFRRKRRLDARTPPR